VTKLTDILHECVLKCMRILIVTVHGLREASEENFCDNQNTFFMKCVFEVVERNTTVKKSSNTRKWELLTIET